MLQTPLVDERVSQRSPRILQMALDRLNRPLSQALSPRHCTAPRLIRGWFLLMNEERFDAHERLD